MDLRFPSEGGIVPLRFVSENVINALIKLLEREKRREEKEERKKKRGEKGGERIYNCW